MTYKTNSRGGIHVPGKPLPLYFRNRIPAYLLKDERTPNSERKIKKIKVDVKTVKHVVLKYANTGSYSPRKAPGKEQYIWDQEATRFIECLKRGRPSITANEIRQEFINAGAARVSAASTIKRVLRVA